jgi:DNA-binding Lrp family transcriptional regulator
MSYKMDLKDKKLLYEIDFNARKTYSDIAKKILMSKRGVEYKIKNLEKNKIITGYYPIINLSKIGYLYFRIFIKFQNLTKKLREDIKKYIVNNPHIGWAIWYYGQYDIGFTIWAKSVTEFKKIANEIYGRFDQYIKTRTESVTSELSIYKNRFLINTKDSEKITLKEKIEEIQLDNIDKKILHILIKNPRISLVDAASILKESTKLLSYRIKRLTKNNILLGIRPILNYEQLRKTYYKVFITLNNFEEKKVKQVEESIQRNPKIIYIVKALGTCDLDIEIILDNAKELFDFIEELQTQFPNMIKEYQTMTLTETIKVKFLPVEE